MSLWNSTRRLSPAPEELKTSQQLHPAETWDTVIPQPDVSLPTRYEEPKPKPPLKRLKRLKRLNL